MQNDNSPQRVTVKPRRAREMLDIGKTTYFRLVKEGVLETVKVGRGRMPTIRGINKLLDAAAEPGGAAPPTDRKPGRPRKVQSPEAAPPVAPTAVSQAATS